MKINMKKIKILAIGALMVSSVACNKEIVCQTCDNGYPVSNLFKNECPKSWSIVNGVNPCNVYETKIDSLQLEIMDLGRRLDSMVLKYDYGWEF